MEEDLVKLNIGGSVFITRKSTLQTFPHSKLARMTKFFTKGELFVDRSPVLFNTVLDFYRCPNKHVHLPDYICGSAVIDEFEFWEIPIENISDCCFGIYTNHTIEEDIRAVMNESYKKDERNKGKPLGFRNTMWLFFDQPRSSRGAMVFFCIYILMVIMLLVLSMLLTDNSVREEIPKPMIPGGKPPMRSNITPPKLTEENEVSWKIQQVISTKMPAAFEKAYLVITIFFGLELFCHFLFCPHKKRFFRNFINIIDLVTFVIIILANVSWSQAPYYMKNESFRKFYIICNCLLFTGLLRILRLMKVYSEFQVLLLSIRASFKELVLLFITFSIFAVFCGSLIYYTEIAESDTFPNIFVGVWWAVVTMTTVGYGDTVPKSLPGFIAGAITSMLGLLIIAMPVAIIAKNFDSFYNAFNNKKYKRYVQFNYHKNVIIPPEDPVSHVTELDCVESQTKSKNIFVTQFKQPSQAD